MIIFLISVLLLIALISFIYWFKPSSGTGVDLNPKGYAIITTVLVLLAAYAGYQVYNNWHHEQRFQVSPITEEQQVKLQGEKQDLMMVKKQPIKQNKAYEATFFLWNEEDIKPQNLTLKAEERFSGDKVQLQIPKAKDLPNGAAELKQKLGANTAIQTQLAFPYWGIWEIAIYQNEEKLGDLVIEVIR
ncbi:hypothetical protein [Pontibacillus marinus]|uniref:Uncharacterized protein n=1 Tax=Pontibacillus marinus BH030004 = DSM 16465 TaxID=1385511 RepID=A0A0A5GCU3_9BACI|nr:hypothetical protein [Pontibacillus marinus]KGX91011.1 hypothetical protein N783_13215 [Pontibacillus marinus BH030004 = DSM 16465]